MNTDVKGRKETGDRRQEKAKDFRRDDQFGRLQHNGRFYNEINFTACFFIRNR